MKVKMYQIDDLEAFMDLVDHCDGQVYVISKEGDKLNLKSKLTQFVALTKLFQSDYIHEIELETTVDTDARKLIDFMINGKGQLSK